MARNSSLEAAEGGGIPEQGFLCKQETHGKRHCGVGTIGREQAGSPVSGQPGRNRWGPDFLPPGPGEELALSWFSQEEVPH